MKKKMSIAADAGLNATGFYNRKPGSIRVSGAAEEVDELDEEIDELEEVDEEAVEAAEADDAVEDADDTADEVVEEVLAEVKAETAESISELEEDTVSEALDDDEGEGEDGTTSVADDEVQHPAEEVQEKEGDTMDNRIAGISLKFLDSIRDYAYEAAINGRLNPELGNFALGIASAYAKSFDQQEITETIKSILQVRPELIDEVIDWADDYLEENTIPEYGWKYKAVGILNGKTFDSEAEAREEVADFIQLGHSFEELFVKDLFYKEDGKLTERIPDDSKHRQLIMAQINKSSQPSANPADDI